MISLRVEILRLGGFRAFCKFIAKRRGTVDRGAGRKIAELENLAELNVAVPGGFGRTRDPQGPIDGFLLGLDLDKPVAGDEFLGFGEGPVDNSTFAIGKLDTSPLRAGMEPCEVEENAGF